MTATQTKECEDLFSKVYYSYKTPVRVDNSFIPASSWGARRFQSIGIAAVPFLVRKSETSTVGPQPRHKVNSRLIAIHMLTYALASNTGWETTTVSAFKDASIARECIPVFLRSLLDSDAGVRDFALGSLKDPFSRIADTKVLIIKYAEAMLNDKSVFVQTAGVRLLDRIGERKRIPKELYQKFKPEESHWSY